MIVFLYRLHFKGPLHLGVYGIDLLGVEEKLSSDSLTSALINAVKVISGDTEASELVNALNSPSPPFVLSSLFPFGPNPKNKNSYAEVLIRPLIDPPLEDKKVYKKYGKELKRIRYLSIEDFKKFVGQEILTVSEIENILERSKMFTDGWWSEAVRPRVALDRLSQNSNIWNQAAIWFSKEGRSKEGDPIKGSGLYGLIRINDEKWKPKLESAFRMLGDMGIGGERTYGLGLFEFGGFESLKGEWKNLFEKPARAYIFLSVYYPAENERDLLKSYLQSWEIVERRGYIVSGRYPTTIKRKRVRMITEGSVTLKPLKGCMVDVTPDTAPELGIPHRVYRSGLAFLVPGGDDGFK